MNEFLKLSDFEKLELEISAPISSKDCTPCWIKQNPLQTMSDQSLYSMLCDLPEDYYDRLIKLMEIAKETRIEKKEYFKKIGN